MKEKYNNTNAQFQNSRVTIFDDCITYKRWFKGPVTVVYEHVIHMISSYVVSGDVHLYNLSLFDTRWHNINLRTFKANTRLEILDFMHETVTPVVIPRLMENFDKGNDINLGALKVNINKGIIQTNNVERTIRWKDIISADFRASISGVGQARITFRDEDRTDIFEFDFEVRNLRKHDLMLEIFERMIGKQRMKDLHLKQYS